MKGGFRLMDTAVTRGLRALRHAGRARCPPSQGPSFAHNDCPPPQGPSYADDDCAPCGALGGQDALPPRVRLAPTTSAYRRRSTWRGEDSRGQQGAGTWERGHLALVRAGRRVLLGLAFGVVAPVSGAEGEDGTDDTEEVGAVVEPVVVAADAAEEDAERPPRPPVARDVFVPSEEISEDVEVPFPVDI